MTKYLKNRVNLNQTPLTLAHDIQLEAAKLGFDWATPLEVLHAIRDEVDELIEAHTKQFTADEQMAELGDIIFGCINLARHLSFNFEAAVQLTNEKFLRRFHHIEESLEQQHQNMSDCSFETLLNLWNEAKHHEHPTRPGLESRD